MASLTLTVEGAEGGSFGNLSTVLSFSDDDSDRILAYVIETYGKTEDGAQRTPQEAVTAMTEAWFSRLVEDVRAFERRKAARDAAAAKAAAEAAIAAAGPNLPYTRG